MSPSNSVLDKVVEILWTEFPKSYMLTVLQRVLRLLQARSSWPTRAGLLSLTRTPMSSDSLDTEPSQSSGSWGDAETTGTAVGGEAKWAFLLSAVAVSESQIFPDSLRRVSRSPLTCGAGYCRGEACLALMPRPNPRWLLCLPLLCCRAGHRGCSGAPISTERLDVSSFGPSGHPSPAEVSNKD